MTQIIKSIEETKPSAPASPISFPLTRPNAPKLSAYAEDLKAIEDSHWLSNYGPVNTRLELAMVDQMFGGVGTCLTINNATTALILALKLASERHRGGRRHVLMPTFTFAAAAQAALWAGLVPVLVDVDPFDWSACRAAEEAALERYGDEVGIVMPYATFGNSIDLDRYDRLAERHGVGVVVDAAASLGSLNDDGVTFGTGSKHLFVFSMHATKAFGVGEAGLVYSADAKAVDVLRHMANFGFDGARSAEWPGLNGKISEIVAFSALLKLREFEAQACHRADLAQAYLGELADWTPQRTRGSRLAYQFMPLRLPEQLVPHRDALQARLLKVGVGTGKYFSPHLAQQRYFRKTCMAEGTPEADRLAASVLSLPISDFMTVDDVTRICGFVHQACADVVRDADAS